MDQDFDADAVQLIWRVRDFSGFTNLVFFDQDNVNVTIYAPLFRSESYIVIDAVFYRDLVIVGSHTIEIHTLPSLGRLIATGRG